MIKRFLMDERGATAIEYGLIAALMAVASIGGMSTLGNNSVLQLQKISNELS